MVNDKILIARENRRKKVKIIAEKTSAVTLKANIPGDDKNLPEGYLIVNYFIKKVMALGAKFIELEDSQDGVTVYFSAEDGKKIKNIAQDLEENHPLGRLIDIDVTPYLEETSLSRKRMRKCFLCDNPAFVCGRNKTHKTTELLRFFKEKTEEHIKPLIEKVILESMFSELNLENKFGLVTPTSNGSHTDLNYKIMSNAIEKMLKATSGANAYKGFIFVGGVLLTSLGYTIRVNGTEDDVYNNAKIICDNFTYPLDTFGAVAHKSGFGGVREEGKKGFPNVKLAEKLLEENNLNKVLIYIISNLEDSVLYKRAKTEERYNYFKNLISTSLSNQEEVTKKCIENNISVGGSADVLIASVMMKKIKQIFYFKV